MPQYLFLLPGGSFKDTSPGEKQKISEEYLVWIETLKQSARYQRAAHLLDTGRVLKKNNFQLTDEPLAETEKTIAGYYQIEANDYDEALAIAKTCPYLNYGGTVEIREVILKEKGP